VTASLIVSCREDMKESVGKDCSRSSTFPRLLSLQLPLFTPLLSRLELPLPRLAPESRRLPQPGSELASPRPWGRGSPLTLLSPG